MKTNIRNRPNRPRARHPVIRDQVIVAAFLLALLVQTTNIILFAIGFGAPINVLKTLMLAPVLLLIIWYHKHSLRGLVAMPELGALLALAILSWLWTVAPWRWNSAILSVVLTGLAAMTLASMLSMRALLTAMGILLAGCTVLSLVTILLFSEARGSSEGTWVNTWRGIFGHKNSFGSAMSFAVVVFLMLIPQADRRTRLVLVALTAVAFFLLFKSESRSSQIVALVGLTGWLVFNMMPHRPILWAFIFISAITLFLGISAILLSSSIADPIFELLGRKPTLSGRIPLWALSLEAIAERPWLGHGFFSFWDPESKRVLRIARDPTVRFVPFYSHNGVIETLLNLGIIGLSLSVLMVLRCVTSFYRLAIANINPPLCAAYLLLVLMFVLSNVLEAPLLSRASLVWIIFIAFATRLCLTAKSLEAGGERAPRSAQAPRRAAASGAGVRP